MFVFIETACHDNTLKFSFDIRLNLPISLKKQYGMLDGALDGEKYDGKCGINDKKLRYKLLHKPAPT